MNNKIELLKAMVNKPIKVEIKAEVKDDLTLVSKRYIYSVDTDSCVVTREYVSEYIIDYEDIYDNINDYEYPYNHVNRCDL